MKPPFTRQELQITLGAARDRENHIQKIEKDAAAQDSGMHSEWSKADRFTLWFSRHYLAVLNTLVVLYVGFPFLAPVLMRSGYREPAQWIYKAYSLVCHQLAFRSFFLFGEQLVYPRAAAGVPGILTLNQATGLSEDSTAEALFAARSFIGDPIVGYKIALCERDIGIYLGILCFGLVFGLTGRKMPAIPWYLWVLLGLVPIGVDGLSQLFSQPPFSLWAFRESTPYLRVLTGGLFGWMTAWFGYPAVEETMAESKRIMEVKLHRLSKKPL
jgi:uncharacterized membrane protein